MALLGDIYRKSNRKERAIRYLKKSVEIDPFFWTSFKALADMGEKSDALSFFGTSEECCNDMKKIAHSSRYTTPWESTKVSTPFGASGTSALRQVSEMQTPGLTPISRSKQGESVYPLGAPTTEHTDTQSQSLFHRARRVAYGEYYPPAPETPVTNVTNSLRFLQGLSGQGDKQFHQTNNGAFAGKRSLFTPLGMEESPKAQEEANEVDTSIRCILDILSITASGYLHLCQYRCKKALDCFRMLPSHQQTSAWVLHHQGRAYLELNEFKSAQRLLELMHQTEPCRMKGLEILSTVYWHLKKEVELSSLAQRVVEWDRESPEAWCVVGNCFSLQKDHDTALLFFRRSLQLDPEFTYSHTLSGYEYMANEDFDKAMACFRQALRTDDRHYNAWYGLGGIYHRQEKYDLAEYHFDRACSIHPSSSILRCNLGIAQYANGKAYQALETLSEASRLDPGNPQARFQRATIYSTLNRLEDALAELEKVRDAVPREATVHFAMGKVWKRLGRSDVAMRCFLSAMDLDPKDSQMIKTALDKLDEPDNNESTMTAF